MNHTRHRCGDRASFMFMMYSRWTSNVKAVCDEWRWIASASPDQWCSVLQSEQHMSWTETKTRLNNPNKGLWLELLYRYSPSWLGNESSHNKLSIIHRQYIPIKKDRLTFAYRVWYHASLGKNKTPFYEQNYLTASNFYEGFGGSNTLRGMPLGRIWWNQISVERLRIHVELCRIRVAFRHLCRIQDVFNLLNIFDLLHIL